MNYLNQDSPEGGEEGESSPESDPFFGREPQLVEDFLLPPPLPLFFRSKALPRTLTNVRLALIITLCSKHFPPEGKSSGVSSASTLQIRTRSRIRRIQNLKFKPCALYYRPFTSHQIAHEMRICESASFQKSAAASFLLFSM